MASNKNSGLAAVRYATALMDVAHDSKKIDSVEKDLNELEAMIAGSEDLQQLIRSPLLSREQQIEAITAIAKKAKFQDITSNFLALLAENRRLPMLQNMINAAKMDISKRRGEIAADVKSAFKLTKAQEKALQESLSKAVGQVVAMNVSVDKDLIGGMVVTVGSQMIDDSVKRKLERLKREMQSNANMNTSAKVANQN